MLSIITHKLTMFVGFYKPCNQITSLLTSYYKYFKVFIRIDEALSNVDDPDILTEILLQTGAFHKKIPGFRPEMFWVS